MGRIILMALQPRFAEAIYNKSKRFEFRRVRAKILSGDQVLIYESAPTSCITGEFLVGVVISGLPAQLIRFEPDSSSRRAAEQYLQGASIATAIEVLEPMRWKHARPLHELLPEQSPPQSYIFVQK